MSAHVITGLFAFASCMWALCSAGDNAFALTSDKVGQGNFAFAKLFALTDDGSGYRFAKRSAGSPAANSFAFESTRSRLPKPYPENNEFAFAFAKRLKFAKRADRFAVNDAEADDAAFAKFAKREVTVLVPAKTSSTGFA